MPSIKHEQHFHTSPLFDCILSSTLLPLNSTISSFTPPRHSILHSTHTPKVTGPVSRFARQIASQGYIVAAPSSYHEFTGPEALAYDGPGTDKGNEWKVHLALPPFLPPLFNQPGHTDVLTVSKKITKTVAAYDEDATLSIDHLLSLQTCNGRIGATGMCLGGHLAYRAALDPRLTAAICYFATDLHSHTLGLNKSDDSLARAKDLKHAELMLIFGKRDNHVPPEGRDLIRKTLHEEGVTFGWYEVAWAQRE